MKKIIIILTGIFFLGLFSTQVSAKDLKVGYVNIFKVFNEYKKTVDYDKKLAQKQKIKEQEIDKKKDKIKKEQNSLSLLKESEQKKQREKILKEVRELQEISRQAFLDLKKERDQSMKEIINDINNVVKKYAKTKKYDLIITGKSLLYANKSMDLTDEIISILNKNYR